jgi:hypothetical protein
VNSEAKVGGHRQAFELRLRNIVTGELRDRRISAVDLMAATAEAFRRIAAENLDQSWLIERVIVGD